MRLYYAQNKEDLLIKAFFPDVKAGFYIDVGANDPVIDSVTKLLYDDGWSGINVEPIKKHIDDLKKKRDRDINLQIGLSDKPGELLFREYSEGTGLSTFDKTMKSSYEKDDAGMPTGQFKEYKVPVTTLDEMVREQKIKTIHFIKIDVEGYEYEVIKGHDWQKVRPELICIEANHINKDWRPLLRKHDYEEVFFDGVNNYYLAKEALHRKKFFDYPAAVFAGNPVYYPAFLEAKREVSKPLEFRNQELNKKIQDLEQEVAFLHRQQRDVRFLAKRLTEELQLRLNKRAKAHRVRPGLIYQPTPALNEKMSSRPIKKQQLLDFIHEQDKQNVKRQNPTLTTGVRPLFWKGASGSFNFGVRTAKFIKRKI